LPWYVHSLFPVDVADLKLQEFALHFHLKSIHQHLIASLNPFRCITYANNLAKRTITAWPVISWHLEITAPPFVIISWPEWQLKWKWHFQLVALQMVDYISANPSNIVWEHVFHNV
jgi:hypothetical protein